MKVELEPSDFGPDGSGSHHSNLHGMRVVVFRHVNLFGVLIGNIVIQARTLNDVTRLATAKLKEKGLL